MKTPKGYHLRRLKLSKIRYVSRDSADLVASRRRWTKAKNLFCRDSPTLPRARIKKNMLAVSFVKPLSENIRSGTPFIWKPIAWTPSHRHTQPTTMQMHKNFKEPNLISWHTWILVALETVDQACGSSLTLMFSSKTCDKTHIVESNNPQRRRKTTSLTISYCKIKTLPQKLTSTCQSAHLPRQQIPSRSKRIAISLSLSLHPYL